MCVYIYRYIMCIYTFYVCVYIYIMYIYIDILYIYTDIFITTYYIPSMFPHATPPKYQVVYADRYFMYPQIIY